jgi:hypothetical protein
LSVATFASSQKHAAKKKSAATQQKAAPTPTPEQATQQQPPPAPPTPEHGPASPPDVKFQGGQLTIVARNSNMSDVLNQVKQKTGASVDMPAASNERVVGQFGPGAPRDVMAQLLNGSHYDYVLLGSPSEPTALKKIVLMARATGPEPPQKVASQPQQPGFQPNPNMQVPQDSEQDQTVVEDSNTEPDQVEQPDQPEVQEQEEPQPGEVQPGQVPGQNPNGGPVVKTPEQLLRELQQQQQQQQAPDQNAPGAPPK